MGVGKSKEKAPIKDRKAEGTDENVEFKGMKKTDEDGEKSGTLGRNKRGTLTRMSGTLTRGKTRVTTLLKNVFPGTEKKKEDGATNDPAAAATATDTATDTATIDPPAVNGHVDDQAKNEAEEVKVVVEQHPSESKPEPAPRKNKKQLRDEFFRMDRTQKPIDPFPPSPAKLRAQKTQQVACEVKAPVPDSIEALVPPPRKRKTSKEEREAEEAEAMAAAAAIDAAVQSKDASPELNGHAEFNVNVPQPQPFIEKVSQEITDNVMEAIPQSVPFMQASGEPVAPPKKKKVPTATLR